MPNLVRPSTVLTFSQKNGGVNRKPNPSMNRKRLIAFSVVTLIHLGILLMALFLSYRPAMVFDSDRVIDLMDMAMPPPPKPQAVAKSPVKTVPDEQRLQVKTDQKTVDPPAVSSPAPTNDTNSNNPGDSGSFLPQSQVDVPPVISAKQIQANTVYPEIAQKMSLEAVVILELFIDQNGKIIRISVLKDPGHGFAEAAVKAFSGISISPAKAGGTPVAVRWRYPIRFTLK